MQYDEVHTAVIMNSPIFGDIRDYMALYPRRQNSTYAVVGAVISNLKSLVNEFLYSFPLSVPPGPHFTRRTYLGTAQFAG
jgi:hypothetical protein